MTPDQRLLASVIGWLLAVAALVAGGAWAGYAWRDRGARADLAECQRVHAEALAITLRAAQKAEAEYREQEAKTAAAHKESMNVTLHQLDAARGDAARARAALDRLRNAAAAAARRGQAASGPATAGDIQAAPEVAGLHAYVLARIGEAAAGIGEEAERYRAAGEGCQRDYDSVTTPRL